MRVIHSLFSGLRDIRVRPLDAAALFVALAVTAGLGWSGSRSDGGSPSVVMRTPAGEWIYPTAGDREFSAYDGAGICRISIRDGSVRVVSSDCPDRICIGMGAIRRPGQWIACVPHRVFLRIEGADRDAPDAVSL